MIGGSLARRYARALLAIGEEERAVRRILSEVETFAALADATPLLREALEAVIGSADFLPATRNFLLLLVDKGRMNVLPRIVAELRRLIEQHEGIERVEVVVPMPLSGSQRELLKVVIERQTGKKAELEEKVDPAVLGGMVVKIGDTVYDGSVRTQIRTIRENLRKG